MPRTKIITQYRYWCRGCNNFELFQKEDDKYLCKHKHEHIPTLISEIPKEKVDEQRLRFKKQRSCDFTDMYSAYTSLFANIGLFGSTSPVYETKIVEDDAGLLFEEQEIRRKRNEEILRRKNELMAFSKVGRNDTCLCGSQKKYKKCCEQTHKTWY